LSTFSPFASFVMLPSFGWMLDNLELYAYG
jgi:hypothetical protein